LVRYEARGVEHLRLGIDIRSGMPPPRPTDPAVRTRASGSFCLKHSAVHHPRSRSRMKAAPLFLAAFALTGCETLTTPSAAGVLHAGIQAGSLVLTNDGYRNSFYIVIEEETAVRVNWAPCVDSVRCDHVPPRSRARVSLGSVVGYEPGRSRALLVYWWHRDADQTGTSADRIRTLHVRL